MAESSSNNNQIISRLFEENADYLFSFAISRVNDQHVAEDLVQETFLSALKSYDSFQNKSKASTWLIAILKNKIIDHYRKRVREFSKESLDGLSTDEYFNDKGHWKNEARPKPWQFEAEKGVHQEEFYKVLQLCMSRLNEIQRMAFAMKYMEDADTTDICKELEITASNYWVIIHRAKLQLRKCLETQWINA